MLNLTADGILEKYPQLENMLKEGAWRKYELQDTFILTRAEVDMILSVLTREGLVENTSLGWRWKKHEDL